MAVRSGPDDEDDEVVVVKDNNDREVCLGRVDNARVNAHRVPQPVKHGFQGNMKHWMPMKVTLARRLGTNTQIIGVSDMTGKDIGTVDVRTASVLAQLMDSKNTTKIRLEARLDSRPKKAYEYPGQLISDNYSITINIFAPLKYAAGLGRLFSQRQVYLQDPIGNIGGKEIYNPHKKQDYTPASKRAQAGSTSRYCAPTSHFNRTAEQVREDIFRVFDTLKQGDELPEMEAPPTIKTSLLKHQKQALYWMSQRERDRRDDVTDGEDEGSLWQVYYRGSGKPVYYNVITGHEMTERPKAVLGGILADVMGLGKTLNALSLVAATKQAAKDFGRLQLGDDDEEFEESGVALNSRATLLICPLSTIANWEDQLKAHVKLGGLDWLIYHGTNRTDDATELQDLDIVVTTYQIVAANCRRRKQNPLARINWFRIVLDEGHIIRSQSTEMSKAACALSATRRWAISGTPVQNRLEDLGALFKFLRIQPFDEPRNFTQYIIAPFKMADTEIIPKLRLLVDSITIRRGKDKLDLPPREELPPVKLQMTDAERSFYDYFARESFKKVNTMIGNRDKLGGNAYAHILRAILRLRQLCAHGADLLSDDDWDAARGFSENTAINLEDEDSSKPDRGPKQGFEMFKMMKDANVNLCAKCSKWINSREFVEEAEYEDEAVEKDTIGFLTPCNQLLCPQCIEDFEKELRAVAGPDGHGHCPICDNYIQCCVLELSQHEFDAEEEAAREVSRNPRLARTKSRYSGEHTKVKALIADLEKNAALSAEHPDEPPIKSVIFSGWTNYLDLISMALLNHKIGFSRLDGTMSRKQRNESLRQLADEPDITCILVSITAGGLGLNLTAASRVYVMEPQFNPMQEAQAIERVHRLGQKRPVIIKKFIMDNSFEERMLTIQEKKKSLAKMSLEGGSKFDKVETARRKMEDLRTLFR